MENVKKLGKITSFTLIIILIASLTVNFPYDATAQEFRFKFGSEGSGDGQFDFPPGIALDSSGNIYVTDFGNHRVQIFNSAGAFLSTFGWGVDTGAAAFETCTSGCQAGISGTGDGQFDFPEGIAVDSSGNIYVADTSNHRVQIFNSTGAFLSTFGWGVDTGAAAFETCTSGCQVGINDSGDGQFFFPEGIAVDSSGNIYVADTNNHRFQKFVNAPCQVPTIPVDMIITEDCILSGIAIAPANVIVQNGAIMFISNDATLDIDFVNNFLRIESGSGVLIKSGGKIT